MLSTWFQEQDKTAAVWILSCVATITRRRFVLELNSLVVFYSNWGDDWMENRIVFFIQTDFCNALALKLKLKSSVWKCSSRWYWNRYCALFYCPDALRGQHWATCTSEHTELIATRGRPPLFWMKAHGFVTIYMIGIGFCGRGHFLFAC